MDKLAKRIEELKHPRRDLLHKAEGLWHRVRVVAIGLGMEMSSIVPAVPATNAAPDIEKNSYDIQNVMPKFEPSDAKIATFASGIDGFLYEKNKKDMVDYIHSATMDDLLSAGLVTKELLHEYSFQPQDFVEMEPQKISNKLCETLLRDYSGTPSGKCYKAIRESGRKVYGCDVYSPTKYACDFSKGLEIFEKKYSKKVPVISCGVYKIGGDGNISKDAIYKTNGCLIVYAGHQKSDDFHSRAGHIGFHFIDDKNGRDLDLCDGKQNFAPNIEWKLGKRYGDWAEVYVMTDVHPSLGLANYLAEHALKKSQELGQEFVIENNNLTIREAPNAPKMERRDFQNQHRIAQAMTNASRDAKV